MIENLLYIAIVIYSIVLHEVAHGYASKLCGDNTAKNSGRLTLNPISHIDPLGSVVVPAMGLFLGGIVFGWAKGVPINIYNLNGSKIKEFIVSFAGIFINLVLAVIFLMIIKLSILPEIYNTLLIKAAVINIGLGFFNLLPIPPFDGMSMLRAIFPSLKHKYQHLEHNPVVMIGLILFAAFIFSFIYRDIVEFMFNLIV